MSQERIAALKGMAETQPDEPMIWYGLANEYIKLENWDEAADASGRVIKLNADYTSAYQLLGTALVNLGRVEEAGRAWAEGLEAATRTGAWKARQHIEGLLAGSKTQERGTGLGTE